MNLGTPIVASNVCGNPEVIEDGVNGLLVDPRRSETLRAAVERVLADPELAQRFARAGLARRDTFRRDVTFSEVERALLQLIPAASNDI
jgi:glycosyltransferase involved in cell wall biosynthesis